MRSLAVARDRLRNLRLFKNNKKIRNTIIKKIQIDIKDVSAFKPFKNLVDYLIMDEEMTITQLKKFFR